MPDLSTSDGNIRYIKQNFTARQMVDAIMALSMLDPDFGSCMPETLTKVGVCAGGFPLRTMLFLLDTVRIGMHEVYGSTTAGVKESYRRVCGRSIRAEKRAAALNPLLEFFCETMLYVRRKLRFQENMAGVLCKAALHAPAVKALMKREGLDGLKGVLHFSGLSLYELIVVTRADDIFGLREDQEKLESVQWAHSTTSCVRPLVHEDANIWNDNTATQLESFFYGATQTAASYTKIRAGVDVWGNGGPDMMSHALALYATLTESRCGAPDAVVGIESDFDFADAPF